MAQASIHFRPVQANSRTHNERLDKLDYVYSDLTRHNESWKSGEIEERHEQAAALCKKLTGRSMQAKATPVKEAVVNLNGHHKMEDLKRLADLLREKKGIDCFQIHIHRDEGKSRDDLNYHAHMLFDWTVKTTGKSIKLNRVDMSQIQDIVSDALKMQRGKMKTNTNHDRLEAVEYKTQQENKKLLKLQSEISDLEQKKNRSIERGAAHRAAYQQHRDGYKAASERYAAAKNGDKEDRADETARKQARRERISWMANKGSWYTKSLVRIEENDLSEATGLQLRELESRRSEIERVKRAYEELQDSLSRAAEEARRIEGSDQHREFKRLKSQITELEADIRRGQRTIENRKSK